MRFQPTVKILRGPVDAAPLIGVLFLLLIFVLLGSQYVFIPGVEIRLPASNEMAPTGAAGPKIAVVLTQTGQLYFENQITSVPTLRAKLALAVRHSKEGLTLVIFADQSARHEDLVKLELLAKEAGIQSAILATRPRLSFQPAAVSTNK